MSGGVDSSVAAALLVEAGYEVVGDHPPDRAVGRARGRDGALRRLLLARRGSVAPARSPASSASRHYLLNHEREFAALVIDDFIREYRRGRTPSPCVVCNREVKFGTLLRRALAWEADGVATGHYARIGRDPASGRRPPVPGARPARRTRATSSGPSPRRSSSGRSFPHRRADEARGRGRAPARSGWRPRRRPRARSCASCAATTAASSASGRPRRSRPGPIVDGETGREVGVHARARRLHHRPAARAWAPRTARRYVLRLDPARNARGGGPRRGAGGVGPRGGRRELDRGASAGGAARRRGAHPSQRAAACRRASSRAARARSRVRFDTPQRAVTPGQSVVFYQGEVVLGAAACYQTRAA